jgi:pyridoxal phosphate enzyme (YggS family)
MDGPTNSQMDKQGYHRFVARAGKDSRDKMACMELPEPQKAARISDNVARVRETIAAAARRSGRQADQIILVGVTKYVEPQIARLLVSAGVTDLGESRPQQLWAKAELLADLPARWHLIGHLQRNKVQRTLRVAAMIHSADSLRLLQEIDTEASSRPSPIDVLLEINVSGDAAKHGFRPDELEPLIPQLAPLKHLAVCGLMTISGLQSDADQTRREFAALRELRDKLRGDQPPNVVLKGLSMGMSGDYEIAIEEGATIVRIGSALFEGLES